MRLTLHAPDQPEIRKLRTYLKQRLGFMLGRFGNEVGPVTVWLQDLDGPRGDRRCFVRIKLIPGTDVVVEADAHKMSEAIDCAVERAGRAIRRALRLIRAQ